MKDRIQSAFSEVRADAGLKTVTAAYLNREIENRRQRRRSISISKLTASFAVFSILAIGIFTYDLYFTAKAHMSIEVNPSIELTLNSFNRVIDTYAHNEDGKHILDEIIIRGKNYNEAAGMIISAMESDGYLAGDALVSVTVQAEDSDREQALYSSLQHLIEERFLSIPSEVEAEVCIVTIDEWQGARQYSMGPAKYLAIRELMEVDTEASPEDYINLSIGQIRQRSQECHSRGSSKQEIESAIPSAPVQHGHNRCH